MRQRFGINVIIGILRGSKGERILVNHFDELRTYGTLTQYAESTLRQVIDTLIWENILYQTEDEYPVLRLGSEYLRLKDEDTHISMKSEIRHAKKSKSSTKSASAKTVTTRSELTDAQNQCFENLRALRTEIAREEHVPPYIVFSDKALIDMCIRLPQTPQEMLQVNGVGQNKLEKYGERFLNVLKTQ